MTESQLYLTQHLDVSRETLNRLEKYAEALQHWQRSINLVSPDTIDQMWERHIIDSAQLIRLAPKATTWADLGSGAGLPGLIIGILIADRPGAKVFLVESNRKKAAFLRDVKHRTGAAVDILPERIESPAVQSRIAQVEIVSARALAPLAQLFSYTETIIGNGARGLFMKGRGAESEIQDAKRQWQFEFDRHPSVSDADSVILDVRTLAPNKGAQSESEE